MATMTIFNIGRRTWLKDQVRGLTKDLPPQGNVELDEVAARRLVMDYPGEFSLVGKATPSTADLERREQSIRDRTANLDKREKELDEREAALKVREDATPANILDAVSAAEKAPNAENSPEAATNGKPGRKPAGTKA